MNIRTFETLRNGRKTAWCIARLGLLGCLALLASCSSSKSNNNGGGGGGSVLNSGEGYCQDSCPKDCTKDDQCDTTRGEMCCKIGNLGSTCLSAKSCPVECADDNKCDTQNGQACERMTLATEQNYCAKPSSAIRTCSEDTQCGTTEVCCKDYDEPICLDPSLCPRSCSDSTECNTANNEICCTTLNKLEAHLSAPGLCVNPTYTACPKTCDTSTDCNTGNGEVCCNGICTTDHTLCPKKCSQSSDCNQQICCKSAYMQAPKLSTRTFTAGPSCKGTPSYTTCSSSGCASVLGCSAPGTCISEYNYTCASYSGSSTYQSTCQSLGCTYAQPTDGSCVSSSYSYSCSSYSGSTTYQANCTGLGCTYNAAPLPACVTSTSSYTCSQYYTSSTSCTNAGCTYTPPSGTCYTEYSYSCSQVSGSSDYESECTAMGCVWDASALTCSGTPASCSTLTSSAACSANINCYWSSNSYGTCTGTPKACSSYTTSTECYYNYNCTWSSGGSPTCTGTPQACSAYSTSTDCANNRNCQWSTSPTCTGTPTSCTTLTNSTNCTSNPNCYWSTSSSVCTGTPTPCTGLSQTQCSKQNGCYWQ